MVPIVLGGLAEEGDDAALVHGDQDLGGSGGFRAHPHGGTGDSAHTHGFLRGGGAQRQSGGGEGGEEQDFRCLSRYMSHVEVRFLSVSGCAREGGRESYLSSFRARCSQMEPMSMAA